MQNEAKRIHSLRISGQDAGQLQQARYYLEEAFRTASLSGLPPNAVVLIRRLDLGPIRLDQHASILANRITEKVRNLAAEAICVDHQSGRTTSVVWFSDTLQAYRALMIRLLDGSPVDEWYWQSLFPNQSLTLNRSTVETLLLDSRQTTAGELSPAYLLQTCLEQHRHTRLFGVLTSSLAQRLLHDLALFPLPVVKHDTAREQQMTTRFEQTSLTNLSHVWRGALLQAIRTWGAQDVRTVWFAISALIAHQPTYLVQKAPLQQLVIANGLTNELEKWAAAESTKKYKISASLPHIPVGEGNKAENDDSQVSIDSPERGEITHSETTYDRVTEPTKHNQQGTDNKTASIESSSEFSDSVYQHPSVRERLNEGHNKVIDQSTEQLSGDSVHQDTGLIEDLDHRQQKRSEQIPSQLSAHASTRLEREQPPTQPSSENRLPFSNHAGFAFLIPLLQRVGLAELLAKHERLLVNDFPQRLFWSLAQRFNLDQSDPNWQLFGHWLQLEGLSQVPLAIEAFCAPDPWWRMAQISGKPLRRYRLKDPGKQMITEPRGRWPLFQGNARSPELIKNLKQQTLRKAGLCHQTPGDSDLCKALQLIAGAWIRRHCGVTLRMLVLRPGRIAITSTHWDVVFDIDQTDLRLRLVALDSDPGWVPWLGKVVQFHFEPNG